MRRGGRRKARPPKGSEGRGCLTGRGGLKSSGFKLLVRCCEHGCRFYLRSSRVLRAIARGCHRRTRNRKPETVHEPGPADRPTEPRHIGPGRPDPTGPTRRRDPSPQYRRRMRQVGLEPSKSRREEAPACGRAILARDPLTTASWRRALTRGVGGARARRLSIVCARGSEICGFYSFKMGGIVKKSVQRGPPLEDPSVDSPLGDRLSRRHHRGSGTGPSPRAAQGHEENQCSSSLHPILQ